MEQIYDGIVVGAGLTGLLLFEHLKKEGKGNFLLLEQDSATEFSERKRWPEVHNQYFLSTDVELLEELNRLHLTDRIQAVQANEAIPLILRGEFLESCPLSLAEVWRSPLLGTKSFLRLIGSLLRSRISYDAELSFYEFLQKISDDKIAILYSRLLGDFLMGGEASKLEILSLYPQLKSIFGDSPSSLQLFRLFAELIKGEGEVKLLRLTGGFSPLVEHFLATYPYAIHYDERVQKIKKVGGLFEITTAEGKYLTTKLYSTLAAPNAANLFSDFDPELSDLLREFFYSSLIEVEMEFRAEDLSPSLKSNQIVPLHKEGSHVIRILLEQIGETKVLRFYLNAIKDNLAKRSDDELIDLVLLEYKNILGITGVAQKKSVRHCLRASPLYHLGHAQKVETLEKKLHSYPGLYMLGNFLKGIRFNEVVRSIRKIPSIEIPQIVKDDPYLEPQTDDVIKRTSRIMGKEAELLRFSEAKNLREFASGHFYFGMHRENDSLVIREWAPNATAIYLVCDKNSWQRHEEYRFHDVGNGNWELRLDGNHLQHGDVYKLLVHWDGGSGERIPSYANYVVQDPTTHLFSAEVFEPVNRYSFTHQKPQGKVAPVIYECHVGMSSEEGKVNSYREFTSNVLPHIKKAGYNTLQIMAIQEHPYYGSFGYQVSNFFASASRSGTPDELKELIDTAHGLGLRVIMDIVHSHAVKNENEGLGKFDGTQYQYFHDGGKGLHPAWDTYLFNYGKNEVVHFLLSNIRYWMEEFQFDGFRFDGVTSMLYLHHGLGKAFCSYGDYFGDDVDHDAVTYLGLANKLMKEIDPNSISVAEDMSGLPGIAAPLKDGGLGFDHRLAMGIPDFWIKVLKEKKDEEWNMREIWGTLMNVRYREGSISYVESHDQALVGDKTTIFWLVDKDMYTNMHVDLRNLTVDRGIALHKMIRLITFITAKDGYLNFMGNEFGHPEWIDFPRVGNNWSYHYARRQWSLAEKEELCYKFLLDFDRQMTSLGSDFHLLEMSPAREFWIHDTDKVIAVERGNLFFFFNFHPSNSYRDYMFPMPQGEYEILFHSDEARFGGYSNLPEPGFCFKTFNSAENGQGEEKISLYLPARALLCLKRI